MRDGAAAGGRLIEVYRVSLADNNNVASTVGDAIIRVCGNIVEKLVHGMGGGISGHGLLGTNGTEGDKDFVFDRAAVPQEGANNALDALDVHIVDRRAEIGLRKVLSLGAI